MHPSAEGLPIPLDIIILHAIINSSSHMGDPDEASQQEDASVGPEDLALRCKAAVIKPSLTCGRTR